MTSTPLLSSSQAGTETSLFGFSIPTTISGLTPHSWVADANGEYQTSTNLQAEWANAYEKMLAGLGGSLTPVQRLEGNAYAVFQATGIMQMSSAQANVYFEDAQREFDAIAGALTIDQQLYGSNPNAPLTQQTYLQLEQTIQNNPTLEELGVQGHGLNSPPAARYDGYTNDIQHGITTGVYFVGGGVDNGQNALANFMDDVIMTHVPFPTIAQNGRLVQLNQNGAAEDQLSTAVTAIDESMYGRVFVAADFSTDPHAHGPQITVLPPGPTSTPTQAAGTVTTLTGFSIPNTMTLAHTWTADANGLFETSTSLAAEWQQDYATMLAGGAGSLNPLQRMEGNAEAVFEATGLSKLSAAQQQVDREDVQRELDAIWAAMQIDQSTLGISDTAAFTAQSYLDLEHTLQSNAALEELAIQGHGLNSPPSARYNGYTNDMQNNVDQTTRYIGGGVDNYEKAVAGLMDDTIMTHVPFPVVYINGQPVQLNQNGAQESSLATAVAGINQTMFYRTYLPSDFKA